MNRQSITKHFYILYKFIKSRRDTFFCHCGPIHRGLIDVGWTLPRTLQPGSWARPVLYCTVLYFTLPQLLITVKTFFKSDRKYYWLVVAHCGSCYVLTPRNEEEPNASWMLRTSYELLFFDLTTNPTITSETKVTVGTGDNVVGMVVCLIFCS